MTTKLTAGNPENANIGQSDEDLIEALVNAPDEEILARAEPGDIALAKEAFRRALETLEIPEAQYAVHARSMVYAGGSVGATTHTAAELAYRDDGLESPGRLPNPMDIHVGSRVRLRRMVIGMSQEKLGEKMGLTFQQIQKYEKGTNRIGASRLHQLSMIMDVPIGFFFEDAPLHAHRSMAATACFAESKTEAFLLDFLNSRDGLELNRAFLKITDPKVRKRVVELVRALSEETSVDAELTAVRGD